LTREGQGLLFWISRTKGERGVILADRKQFFGEIKADPELLKALALRTKLQ
jgi:hypothetical protein